MGIKNGDLLRRATGSIDVLVTMDHKLEKQHDFSKLPFGVLVIVARSNRIPDLLPLVDRLREALEGISLLEP